MLTDQHWWGQQKWRTTHFWTVTFNTGLSPVGFVVDECVTQVTFTIYDRARYDRTWVSVWVNLHQHRHVIQTQLWQRIHNGWKYEPGHRGGNVCRRAHTQKNPYKGMQVNALKIRNLSRPSDNVLWQKSLTKSDSQKVLMHSSLWRDALRANTETQVLLKKNTERTTIL